MRAAQRRKIDVLVRKFDQFARPLRHLVTALDFWAMKRCQICWSHLLRELGSFSERDGPASSFGRVLLDYTGILFS